MPTPRDVVFDLLRRWTRLEEPPFLPERSDETFSALPPRDRAFAFDLLTGVIRWRTCLDAIIASRLRQPLELLDLPVRAILWLGAYQLLFQGGTADYAAVDTTVNLAKAHRETAKAGGLVNAVLRGITRLNPTPAPRLPGQTGLSRRTIALDFATQLFLNDDIFIDPARNPIGHLAAVRSHPPRFVEHLRDLYGESRAADLLLRNNLRPIITLRADADTLDVPAAAGLVAHGESPRFLAAKEGWNPLIEQLVAKGTLSPQDPTSAKPVRFFAEQMQRGMGAPSTIHRILDLCAGLGTKSIQLARAFPQAQITVADIDTVKLARLQMRAKQIGQKNIITADPAAISASQFDVILVDVPCSNTGVMAKRVQSRWRWPSLDHAALKNLQLQLLNQGAQALAPGGTLLYSTCSIDPAENEKLVAAFLQTADDFTMAHQESTLPSLTNAAESTHDGGYFAVLRKTTTQKL